MKYLYKYPQGKFPYEELVETNHQRTRDELEFELIDTGAFNEDRYFDVFMEFAYPFSWVITENDKCQRV